MSSVGAVVGGWQLPLSAVGAVAVAVSDIVVAVGFAVSASV